MLKYFESEDSKYAIVDPQYVMKSIGLVIFICIFAVAASAQSSQISAGPEVKIVSKKWKMNVRYPLVEGDPNKEANDRLAEERQRREIERLNERLREQNMPARDLPSRAAMSQARPAGISVSYEYEIKVTNIGNKKIRGIIWEYLFIDTATEKEIGRRRFASRLSLDPGKSKTIKERSSTPPTRTVDASKAGKKEKDLYQEQILIRKVVYEDRTEWNAPRLRMTR